MKDQAYSSQFSYTEDELELMKVIAHQQSELEHLHRENIQIAMETKISIERAEAFARKKGISAEQLERLRQEVSYESSVAPESGISWEEIVAEADIAIPGFVTLEDICSAREFEDAFRYVKEIEAEFKEKTGLTKTDVAFIAVAVALQCSRQYVIQPFLDNHRITHAQNDKLIGKLVPKKWQDILLGSVPYDATKRDVSLPKDTGISGSTHRYRTLGHDPILGWVFGPVNILSDTLTKNDFVSSYAITNMKIGPKILTSTAFENAFEQSKVEANLPISIARQGIHFGSDFFSKQGLPIPIISSINNDVSKYLINNKINMLNVTEGAMLSTFINTLTACVHSLFNKEGIEPELYEVRTRKILSISNAIASASNIAYVAITKNVKMLDLGGLLVTISRLFSDARFIARVKQEFIEGKLNDEWERISNDIDILRSKKIN